MKARKGTRILCIVMAVVFMFAMTGTAFAEEEEADDDRASILYDRTTLHGDYDSTPIDDDTIEDLLNAAFSAPTGANQRAIEFFPVTDSEILQGISEISGNFSGVASAPLAIVICGDLDGTDFPELLEMDSGLAAMAMIVQATDLGISSCVMSISPQEERISGITEQLSLTENFLPILLVTFGYPSEDAVTSASVYNYDASQVHYNGLEEDYERQTEEEDAEDTTAELAEGDTYSASAEGISSTVTVTVVMEDGILIDCAIDASGETPDIGGAAAEEIQEQLIQNGSLEFDAVSGATITSDAIASALEVIAEEAGIE
ncbi:MAG: nitroreductase family protein [Lachnospiraceae bacterium]|nr:nitroreductase family protein [Lachnospiraceae bacterium]